MRSLSVTAGTRATTPPPPRVPSRRPRPAAGRCTCRPCRCRPGAPPRTQRRAEQAGRIRSSAIMHGEERGDGKNVKRPRVSDDRDAVDPRRRQERRARPGCRRRTEPAPAGRIQPECRQRRKGKQSTLADDRPPIPVAMQHHPQQGEHLGEEGKVRVDVVRQKRDAAVLEIFLRPLEVIGRTSKSVRATSTRATSRTETAPSPPAHIQKSDGIRLRRRAGGVVPVASEVRAAVECRRPRADAKRLGQMAAAKTSTNIHGSRVRPDRRAERQQATALSPRAIAKNACSAVCRSMAGATRRSAPLSQCPKSRPHQRGHARMRPTRWARFPTAPERICESDNRSGRSIQMATRSQRSLFGSENE